jgi:GNAT superfamily N-acetyltransferase
VIEIRHEPPDGAAAEALFAAYMDFARERVGPGLEPTEEIFGSPGVFTGPGSAWLVLYEDGVPVACGGLRPLAAGVAEIKRMFVTAAARGRGHGRALLAELERRARDAGYDRVRLYTTEVLLEARALYADAGYHRIEMPNVDDRAEDVWLEKRL